MTDSTQTPGLSIGAWQQEATDPAAALDRLERWICECEPRIQALVPEEGRHQRLSDDIRTSASGPLARVPIGIKDIFQVDGLETRAGSRLPASELTGKEADSVAALKRAGAIVLGKTVSTEFAYFAPGPTRNPHHREHTPGGSSSGSAAAVAAGYCPLALGTQTIGSISRPASYCGVVGYKPTFGRISAQGVIPLSPSLDHVGVFANNVADAQIAASIVNDEWSAVEPGRQPILGIPKGPYLKQASARMLEHFRRWCSGLESQSFEIQAIDLFPDFSAIETRHQLILAAETAQVHRDWFHRYGHLYHPKTRQLIERGQTVSDAALARELEEMGNFRQRLAEQTEQAGIDLWLSPAAPGSAPRGLESTGNPVMNLPWTQAGVPTLGLPAGTDDSGLPLGLQIAGRSFTDESLLAWGQQLELALGRLS